MRLETPQSSILNPDSRYYIAAFRILPMATDHVSKCNVPRYLRYQRRFDPQLAFLDLIPFSPGCDG